MTTRAIADGLIRSSDSGDVDRALTLAPGNASYWLRRADLCDRDMVSPVFALERAAALNRLDTGVWIRLGLEAEARGNLPRAESYLLQAAKVSRRYQPRWTLANYYFRRGSAAEFWDWTQKALELEPPDPAALFQLCWRMSDNPGEILNRGIPRRRQTLRNYSHFLLTENRIDAAGQVIGQLLPGAQPEDRDLLLEASDRFLASEAIEFASAAWNTLCDRKLMPCTSIHPSSRISLDDAAGARSMGHGFAWHIAKVPGVTANIGAGLTQVELSGRQPEQLEILWRWIPVPSGQRWFLRFEYRTSGVSAHSGLAWQVLSRDSTTVLASSKSLSSDDWANQEVPFEVPAGVKAVRLRLSYSRLPGEVRREGSLSVRATRLEREQ